MSTPVPISAPSEFLIVILAPCLYHYGRVLLRILAHTDTARSADVASPSQSAPTTSQEFCFLGRRLRLRAAALRQRPVARATQDDAYLRTCAACHGPQLRGGETGPALIGSTFAQHWGAVPAVGLDEFTRRTMPPTAPGSLSDADTCRRSPASVAPMAGWCHPRRRRWRGTTRIPATAEWLNNRGDLEAAATRHWIRSTAIMLRNCALPGAGSRTISGLSPSTTIARRR